MIVNETTAKRDQNDTDINNYRSPYGLQQRAKTITHNQLQKAREDNVKQFNREN